MSFHTQAYVYLRPVQMEAPLSGKRPGFKWVPAREIVYLTGEKRGTTIQPYMRLNEARAFCRQHGLITTLPSLSDIKVYTAEKSSHFFTHRSRKFHDKGRSAHALTVERGEDGQILVSNGRSQWEFTGCDLMYRP